MSMTEVFVTVDSSRKPIARGASARVRAARAV
jgi:hypothetical protein